MKTDIGKNIEKIRISKGLKQSDISDKLNIDNSSYSRLEKKGNKISFDILERIADALSVDIKEILGISLPKNDSLEIEQLKKRNEELELFNKRNNNLIARYENEFCSYYQSEILGGYVTSFPVYDENSTNINYEAHESFSSEIPDEDIEEIFNKKVKFDSLAKFMIDENFKFIDDRIKILYKKYDKLKITKKASEGFTIVTFPNTWVKLKD